VAVKTERFVDPFDSASVRQSAWRFGMWIFVVVVAMLFGAAILGYVVVRLDDQVGRAWRPVGAPGLPKLLLLSTLFVAFVSLAHVFALRAARADRSRECGRAMVLATVGAFAFLVVQGAAWWQLVVENLRVDQSLYAYTFFLLTGLHALHVIGGMPSMWLTMHRARRGRYGPGRATGIELSALYWHTLAVVWLVLYATLWLGSGDSLRL